MPQAAEPSPLMRHDLILGLLASSEPFHKLRQSGWEGSLDRTAGNPQPISQPLKLTGGQGLIYCGMG
jgi:hypothetical protein